MKKCTSWLLILALFVMLLPLPTAAAAADTLYLPTQTATVEEEAFAGDTDFSSLVVPEQVDKIEKRAFAGCTGLKEVYFLKNNEIEIAPDAFAECGDIHFIVFPDTPAELFALSHGYLCDRAVPGTAFYDRITGLVAEHGGTSVLQSAFDSMRLIVRRHSNRLPDISAYNPTEIVRDGDVFIIQFGTVEDTSGCYTFLFDDAKKNSVQGDFVEVDRCVKATISSVSAAGVVDDGVWSTDDPMGFDVYAPFVAAHNTDSVTIAIVDSGVKANASYSRLLRSDGRNMLGDGEDWTSDYQNHGSYIASVIGECVGKANVSILPVRVVGTGASDSANIDYALLGNGIKYAVQMGADIINLSMSFEYSDYVAMCIDYALEKGRTVVVAAGNAGVDIGAANVFPANHPGVVTVAGLDQNYRLRGNYGAAVDYCAPYSYVRTAAFGLNEGTSFSAPMIASAIALATVDPYHDPVDLKTVCFNGNETGTGANSYGYGMPQLDKLANIPVISIAMDSELPGELTVGQELELLWRVNPENATDRTVTPSSSDESVLAVNVNDDGTVTASALRQGTAALTLTSNSNPNVSVSRTFTVVQPVEEITILGVTDPLVLGKTMQLNATVSPENATAQGIEWSSSDESVAIVSETGLVEGVSESDVPVVITAKAKDGHGAQASVSFQVKRIPNPDDLTLTVNGKNVTDGKIFMAPGEALQIETQISPAEADQSVSFEVSGNYVTVSKAGVVKAKTPGTAYVRVYAANNMSIRAELEIHVRVLPDSVQLVGETTVDEGKSVTLTATVLPSDAEDKSLTWKSSDESVAWVSSSGVVTGVKAGTAQISATANADPTVKAYITVTVQHPYDLKFEANKPEDGLTPRLSGTSLSAISGEKLGTLPTASCDYYDFLGWYTEPSGGERKTDSSVITTTESTVTLYAQWRLHEESVWVLTSEVPADARITQTSYSYRESVESTDASMSGWIANGSYWKQTNTGSKQYASFPSTYNTSHSTYKDLNGSAYTPYENEAEKRTVSNTHTGYVYWHWAYNAAYANNTDRWISDRKQTAGASRNLTNYAYSYFFAFKSTTNAPTLSGFTYTWGANAKYNSSAVTYNCASCLPSGADKSATSGLNNPRFLRLNYYTSTFTDYQKIYKYYRDLNYQTTDPGTGADGVTVTNTVIYVKYIAK